KEISFEEWAGPEGTEIQVLGLFHHTPARKKYMKSEKTEYARSFDWICQIALAHPEVGFRLKRDGNEVLNLPMNQDLKERVRGLFGREAAEALLPVHYEQSNLKLSGYVGKPEMARSSKRYQFLFVNGRAIEARAVSHAVKEAFHSLLMHEKYPWFLLNLDIDPAFVDVNVHPRKLEVRFLNPQEVFQTVLRSVHRGLENSTAQVIGKTYSQEKAAFSFPDSTPAAFSFPRSTQEVRDFAPSAKLFEIQGQAMRPVAQIGNSYIIAESEEGLVLIDQHAAHERVRYTRFMEAQTEGKPLIQPLLTPQELELGANLSQLVQEHIQDLQDLGFELEEFGPATYLLRAVPAGLEKKNPTQVVQEILTELADELKSRTLKDFKEALLTMTACRGAIKFGDPLTLPEMQALLNDMESTKHATHCPHGRPALVTLTFDGLETLFKRKNF
ncbi:MAG: DNA mismatch repair endonuclease MutL, partial [Patescibacteria group bacterium]